MTGAAVVLLLGLAAITSTGVGVAVGKARWSALAGRLAARPGTALLLAVRVRDRLLDRLGPVGAFFVLMAAAIVPIAACCHVLGIVAQHVPVTTADVRLNSWFLDERARTRWLHTPVRALNNIANWPETLTVSVLASVGLAFAVRQRRWLPGLLIGTVVLLEWCLQSTLNFTLDPAPPPTGAGLFPSGGTARVIAVYGVVTYLVLRRARAGWPAAATAWTAVAVTAFLQAFARLFAGYHWTSDIAGGVVLGVLLLSASLFAITSFEARVPREEAHRSPHG